jgi:hypothetical protein
LKKENIKSRFRVFRIWPLNHAAMVTKFGRSNVFITTQKEEHELSYHSNATDESNNNEDNHNQPFLGLKDGVVNIL